jgi:beta-galactosidase
MNKRPFIILSAFLLLFSLIEKGQATETYRPETSVAGFIQLPGSGRQVYNFNPGWRFFRGDVRGAEAVNFDDRSWNVVSTPHTVELMPAEGSGCRNYQGPAWYRKHFVLPAETKGQRVVLHFEAAMGKQILYLNGKRIQEHLGGYLPFTLDLTANGVQAGDSCLLAVFTDNSDDKSYPPGKRQYTLDFAYHGGIYRDVWMIAKSPVAITDAIDSQTVGGGGVFVHFDKISEKSAQVYVNTEVQNDDARFESVTVETTLTDADGKVIKRSSGKLSLKPGEKKSIRQQMEVKNPTLWSPDTPYLYRVQSRIKKGNKSIDGGITRVGIRLAEFRGKDGFWLNGKPYESPLIGANRHQDFAVVGNAVANSIHWRDAKKLRDAGMKVIRNAHCPQDPAFMDACDELGLFVIVNTPGWQFWNDAPEFAQRVYSDIRNLVRRDRNHACVWMWEPILNETWYPENFAKNTRDIVDQEYPYPYCYSGCDSGARGKEHFPILFTHPSYDGKSWGDKNANPKITYFTREWGDNVDDWSSHNSPSRVARNWGEQPMLIQAQHYANPTYTYTCYDALYRTPRQHVGGCLWHSFDHQRGYHPDPFYGGLMDVFRQPKYSYYMFKAQRSPRTEERLFETGPMVYIAHEMTPFSGKDVTVYSNCDEVRLTFLKDGKTYTYNKPVVKEGMPSPVITFPDVYDFMVDKAMSRKKKQDEVLLRAEGLIDGKVVATHEVHPARRPEKVLLWVDNENVDLEADGSDFVTVVAAIADKNGNIKRLNNYYVKFHVEGEGRILGDAGILANPAPVKWGTAPVLIQSTLKPGKIKVTASVLFEGSQMPVSAVLELESYSAAHPLIYLEKDAALITDSSSLQSAGTSAKSAVELEQERILKEQNAQRLKEVEQQQEDFGEKNK